MKKLKSSRFLVLLFIVTTYLFGGCDKSLESPHTQVCGSGWGIVVGNFSAKCCQENNAHFDVWDVDRNISDRNISTQVVSTDFNLTIASLNDDNNDTQEFNGTVCFKVIGDNNETDYDKVFFNEVNETNVSFNVGFISKDSYVNVKWLRDTNESETNCSVTLDGETNSTDDFALRPEKFYFELNETQFYAGENFGVIAYAYDENNNTQKDYNETSQDGSFEINATELKVECVTSDENFSIEDINFTDGSSVEVNGSYSGLGDLNITLKEVVGSEFAKVDNDDTNDEKRLIQSYSKIITIQPYEINVTSTDIGSSNGKNWVYMAQPEDLNISFKTTISVNNKQHQPRKDFNSTCYAKDVNITFKATTDGDESYPMVYISIDSVFDDNSTKKEENLSDINQTLTISSNNFIGGEASARMDFNYDRNYSNRVHPFQISGLGVDINSTDIAKIENNDTSLDDGEVVLYFGRINPKAVRTSKDINYSLTIEVYDDSSSSYVNGFVQNSLNWYEMALHNDNIDGNITNIIPKTNHILSSGEEFSIDVISNPKNGKIFADINNSTTGNYILHVKTKPWLWYALQGYGEDYNDSEDSTCIEHPCLKYIYINIEEQNISTGNYTGGDVDVDKRGDVKKIGLKVYR